MAGFWLAAPTIAVPEEDAEALLWRECLGFGGVTHAVERHDLPVRSGQCHGVWKGATRAFSTLTQAWS